MIKPNYFFYQHFFLYKYFGRELQYIHTHASVNASDVLTLNIQNCLYTLIFNFQIYAYNSITLKSEQFQLKSTLLDRTV